MAQPKEREPEKLPKFRDEHEMGEFGDAHSPLDYPEEFQAVDVRFSKPLIKRGLTIKLSEATIEQLREIAQQQGIGPSTLARMWILDQLRERTKQA